MCYLSSLRPRALEDRAEMTDDVPMPSLHTTVTFPACQSVQHGAPLPSLVRKNFTDYQVVQRDYASHALALSCRDAGVAFLISRRPLCGEACYIVKIIRTCVPLKT